MLEPDPKLEEFSIRQAKARKKIRPIPSSCAKCDVEPFDSKTQLDEHVRLVHPTEPVFNDAKREEFLRLLRNGMRFFASTRLISVSPETVKRAMRIDPTFAEAVSLAEEEAAEEAETLLWVQARSGNLSAIVKILDKRQEKRWAANPQVVEVRVSGEVKHKAELMPHQQHVYELQARAQERMRLNGTSEIIDAEVVEEA